MESQRAQILPGTSTRRRGSRSVSGCLTCRRRKVKCVTSRSPCDNCTRLRLHCVPSFHSNFKKWTAEGITKPVEERECIFSPSDAPSGCEGAYQGSAPPGSLPTTKELVDFTYVESPTQPLVTTLESIAPDDIQVSPALLEQSYENGVELGRDLAFDLDFTDTNHSLAFTSTVGDHGTKEVTTPLMEISSTLNLIPRSMPQDMMILDAEAMRMPTLLTTKYSPWNPYQYMLDTAKNRCNSPLHHAILSWTSAYLACQSKTSFVYDGAVFYISAADAVRSILTELSSFPLIKDNQAREKLYLLLASAYFLNCADLMLCNFKSFSERTDAIKACIERYWGTIRHILGTLESRLLIWLAHLDLCSSLLISRRRGVGRPRDFVSTLSELGAFPQLRSYPEGQSYLSPYFGHNYPRREIEEDLEQEPCHLKFDEVLTILSDINEFANWEEDHCQMGEYDGMVKELRKAKIQALRANIARVRAECALLLRDSSTAAGVNRTIFHSLTVTALLLSATIMLNRIVEPDIRSDTASQAAAREIIMITRRFRKSNYLMSPRSSYLWPLPIFIAGIETTDVVYQDWVVSLLVELEPFGGHIRKARELLETIISWQDKENKRMRLKDTMEDLNSSLFA